MGERTKGEVENRRKGESRENLSIFHLIKRKRNEDI
jgi:hypothetical protein